MSIDDAYVRASHAAAKGDAVTACAALADSKVLSGIRHLLVSRCWLSADEADEIVADALAELFERMILRPRPVANLAGLLWRICSRRAVDRVRRRAPLVHLDDRLAAEASDVGLEAFDREAMRRARLHQALLLARALVPQVGHATAQRVLSYLLDAIERGEDRITDSEIAAALGLSRDQARMAETRALQRLTQLAHEMPREEEVVSEREAADVARP